MKDSPWLSVWRSTPAIVALLAILALPMSAFAAVSAGIGFFVTLDGYFLTCFQVIDGAQSISLKTGDGRIFDAEIIVGVDTNRRSEEEQAEERGQAERLRRARVEQEARRTEAARKLEAEQIRQRESNRL